MTTAVVTNEDALLYLPRVEPIQVNRGHKIYEIGAPAANLYMVASGCVALTGTGDDGQRVVYEVLREEEIFGESGLCNSSRGEDAVAVQDSELMAWPMMQIFNIMRRQPELAIALLQTSARRAEGRRKRIRLFATASVQERLVRALVQLAGRSGVVAGLSQEFLSDYVGTSREMVTMHIGRLRRFGYIKTRTKQIGLSDDLRTAAAAGAWTDI